MFLRYIYLILSSLAEQITLYFLRSASMRFRAPCILVTYFQIIVASRFSFDLIGLFSISCLFDFIISPMTASALLTMGIKNSQFMSMYQIFFVKNSYCIQMNIFLLESIIAKQKTISIVTYNKKNNYTWNYL